MGLYNSVDAKLYFLSTGTRATWNATVTDGAHVGPAPASLTEIKIVKDIQVPIEFAEADITSRLSYWEAVMGTIAKVAIDIPMLYDITNTGLLALQKAMLVRPRTTIALAILDGDKATVGTQGLWADFTVLGMSKDEKLEDVQMVTWKIKPGYSGVQPEFVQVAA